jgi:hypothetical protein
MTPSTQPLSDATLRWWDYDRPASFEVFSTTVDIPVRDGVTIACELRRPARDGEPADGSFPSLVLEFTPYVVLRDYYRGEADYFVSRGYNVLIGTLRGIGGSGGTWNHGSFQQCGRDAHDLIEWMAAQPFSTDRVGMYGESFGGQTSYAAAREQPEHLIAIAPMQAPSSLYFDVIFPGGIKTTERGTIDNWPDVANLTSGGVIDADAEFAANRSHPTYDDYWRERSFLGGLDAVPRADPCGRRVRRRVLSRGHVHQHRSGRRTHLVGVRSLAALLSRGIPRSPRAVTEHRHGPGSCRRQNRAARPGDPPRLVRPLARLAPRGAGAVVADGRVLRRPRRRRRRVAGDRRLDAGREGQLRPPARSGRHPDT